MSSCQSVGIGVTSSYKRDLEKLEQRLFLSGNTFGTATPLTLIEDPSGSGYHLTHGIDEISIAGETDYWSFEALAGDVITMTADTPTGSLNSVIELLNAAGGVLTFNHDSGPDQDAMINHYTIASSGTYYSRITGASNTIGAYDMRIDLARGTNLESDSNYSNDTINTAQKFPLTIQGLTRTTTVAGTVMASQGSNHDEDMYWLGYLTTDNTVELSVRLPSSSTLAGSLSVVNAQGATIPDDDGI
ncbi:MAG: hypothetical protein ACYTGQ_16520, partial [Planctomycetota bacterium]